MKHNIFVLVLILNSFLNAQESGDAVKLNAPNCGLRPLIANSSYEPSKIVGGTQALVGDWGWQVSIKVNYGFSCGGFLINSQWILTAAHCLYGRENSSNIFQIDLGVHNRLVYLPWSIQNRKISKLIIHPRWSLAGGTWQDDIALLKFDYPITYSNYILPVCIPQNSDDFAGLASTATGWGTTRPGGTPSSFLNQVTMPWLSDERCKQKYTTVNVTVAICAGETGGNMDTCQGDSGGPLVVKLNDGKYYAGGITSWGYGCTDGGVYTRTSFYYDWISNIIKNN